MSVSATEVQVLEATLEQIRRGFTPDTYFRSLEGNGLAGPGPEVGVTCAIGGVEQGLWKITGKIESSNDSHPRGNSIYARVMRRLNRITRELYPKDDEGYRNANIESITCYGSELAAKRRVLKVIRTALAEVR